MRNQGYTPGRGGAGPARPAPNLVRDLRKGTADKGEEELEAQTHRLPRVCAPEPLHLIDGGGEVQKKHHSAPHLCAFHVHIEAFTTRCSQPHSHCCKGYGSGAPWSHAAKARSGPDWPDPSPSTFHAPHCAGRAGRAPSQEADGRPGAGHTVLQPGGGGGGPVCTQPTPSSCLGDEHSSFRVSASPSGDTGRDTGTSTS